MIDKTLHQYAVLSHLGDGGMGAVYYGKNTNLDQEVALKILHPHLARDARLMERFKNEALIQAKLKHPNIIRVTDFVQEGSECAIIMEYIKGKTFDEILEENGKPLPIQRVIELFIPLLSALDFAHSKGVIHRDIKPNNLILQQMHGNQMPMIMDFGVARIMGASKRMTATGTKMGTPYYMSPEQARSERDVDHRTDIYSMAVSMYEMLSGHVPFDRDSDYGLMDAIIKEPSPPIRQLNPLVPPWLEGVLMTAMKKEPNKRFASAGLFAMAITQQSQTPPPPPQPPQHVPLQHQAVSPPMGSPIQTPIPPKGKTVVDPAAGNQMATPSGGMSKNSAALFFGIAALFVVLILGVLWISIDTGTTTPTPSPDTPTPFVKQKITRVKVRNALDKWKSAQNERNPTKYAALFDSNFKGVKRTKSGKIFSYYHNKWIKDRTRMMKEAEWLDIEIKDLKIDIDKSYSEATAVFMQYYRSDSYCDKGEKVIRFIIKNGIVKIVYEEMKWSLPTDC